MEVTDEMLKAMQSVPPEAVKAGIDVFLWWKSDDFSQWFDTYQGQGSDVEVLVRAMWSAMKLSRRTM